MKRSEIKIPQPRLGTYIEKVEDIELMDALENYGKPYFLAENEKLKQLGDKIYAPGKWTVKDIIQHLIDTERIFAYRALRFARNDKTLLPGFEQSDYAVTAEASCRELNDLLEEYFTVRDTTVQLFKSFTNEMLMREGQTASGTITVAGIGFAIAGHTKHHVEVLKEKYYGLL